MSTASETPHDTEAERLRLVNELATDSGAGWADGFRPGTPGCHELMDRASMLADMLERYLLTHPACVAEPQWYALADRAASALRELYQQVGAEHLAVEENATTQHNDVANQPNAPTHAADEIGIKQQLATPTETPTVENNDLEQVARYLHDAARSAGQVKLVRQVISRAASTATGMYSLPDDHATMEEDEVDDGFGASALARFTAEWDKCERNYREDEAKG